MTGSSKVEKVTDIDVPDLWFDHCAKKDVFAGSGGFDEDLIVGIPLAPTVDDANVVG